MGAFAAAFQHFGRLAERNAVKVIAGIHVRRNLTGARQSLIAASAGNVVGRILNGFVFGIWRVGFFDVSQLEKRHGSFQGQGITDLARAQPQHDRAQTLRAIG